MSTHFSEKCEILCNFCSAHKILMKLLSETRKMLKLPLSDVIFVAVSLLDFSVHVPDNKITWQLCAVNCRANIFFFVQIKEIENFLKSDFLMHPYRKCLQSSWMKLKLAINITC